MKDLLGYSSIQVEPGVREQFKKFAKSRGRYIRHLATEVLSEYMENNSNSSKE